jgi:hypothetical protein
MPRLGAIRARREEIQELRALFREQKVVILKPFLGAEDAGAARSEPRPWVVPSMLRRSKLTAPDFERLARIPCLIASLAIRLAREGERMVAVSDGRVQWDDA